LDAAKKGAPIAMFQIADMLEVGRGLKQDLPQAYAYMTACSKVAPADSDLGKQSTERLAKLKGKMSLDEVKAGDEAFEKLTGTPNKPAPVATKEAPTKETTPKDAPKKPK
jgi:hypothetical protein